jgi:hypothetical protein
MHAHRLGENLALTMVAQVNSRNIFEANRNKHLRESGLRGGGLRKTGTDPPRGKQRHKGNRQTGKKPRRRSTCDNSRPYCPLSEPCGSAQSQQPYRPIPSRAVHFGQPARRRIRTPAIDSCQQTIGRTKSSTTDILHGSTSVRFLNNHAKRGFFRS